MRIRLLWFLLGVVLAVTAEVLRVYLVMPFPGSQRSNSVELAHFLDHFIWWFRIAGLIAVLPALRHDFVTGGFGRRVTLVVPLLACAGVLYFTNQVARAEKIFRQPRHAQFAHAAANAISGDRLVIGITRGDEAKAYPIELIGYHHQVPDEIAGTPVLVTYCTVCRTGRVFSPVVNGRRERFRLVGMDHFNAMIEDGTTRSWWRQATGEAVAGPLKGARLAEIPSEQMTLHAWLERHPGSRILQPDPEFRDQYRALRGFDDGTRGGSLTGRRTESWQEKSWVVGVADGPRARAYDWNDLQRLGIINDRVGTLAIVLWAYPDGKSFSVRNRVVGRTVLSFIRDANSNTLVDSETRSVWGEDGRCIQGSLKGTRLAPVQSYQEFWHSWRTFHPGTETYRPGTPTRS